MNTARPVQLRARAFCCTWSAWLVRTCVLALVIAAGGTYTSAQEAPSRDSGAPPAASGPGAQQVEVRRNDEDAVAQENRRREAAERWRSLSPERRAELLRRLDEARALAPEERARLLAHARELERIERDVLAELTSDQRQRLDQLAPEARRELVRELAADRARERAERLREVIAPADLEALHGDDPERRRRFLDERRAERERRLPHHLRRLGAELDLPPGELARLEALPREVLHAEIGELLRRRAERWAAEHGLPPGVGQAEWQRWLEGPPDRFARRYGRLRDRFGPSFGPLGPGPGPGPGPDPSAEGDPGRRRDERPVGRPQGGPEGPRRPPGSAGGPEGPGPPDGVGPPGGSGRPGGPPRGGRGGPGGGPGGGGPGGGGPGSGGAGGRGQGEAAARPSAAAELWLQQLRAAGAPTIEDRLTLAELPPAQRRDRMHQRMRSRAEEVLRRLGATEEELAALRPLPHEQFRPATRDLVLRHTAQAGRDR
jgi:hypothetical protein